VANPEYLDGCCYVVKRDVLVDGALFPPEFEFMYCEDADLSLRIRASGKKLCVLPNLKFHRDESEKTKTTKDISYYHEKNMQMLRRRWGQYLKYRMNPPVPGGVEGWGEPDLAKPAYSRTYHLLRSGARGDVLLLTPVARALKERDPLTKVVIWTRTPDLIQSKFVDELHVSPQWPPDLSEEQDRGDYVYNLDLEYERRPHLHAAKAYAEPIKVPVENVRPDIYVSGEEIISAREMIGHTNFVLVDMGATWANREWSIKSYRALFSFLRKEDIEPVVVGVGRPVPDGVRHVQSDCMFDLVPLFAIARAFVGQDGAWMHVAQAFGTPSVLLFSVAQPHTRVGKNDWTKTIVRDDLPCLHCLQRRPAPRQFTPCDKGSYCGATIPENECMNISPDDVIGALKMLLKQSEEARA
jgi:ADP-heptose:LPS heptosyltransferase